MRTLTPSRRRAVTTTRALVALLALALSLAFAPTAFAFNGTTTVTASQPDPVVGENVTYSASLSGECPSPFRMTWSVDGTVVRDTDASGDYLHFTYAWSSAGSHTVTAQFSGSGGCEYEPGNYTDDVGPAVGGVINVTPQPLNPNRTATLAVVPENGQGGYQNYQWKIDGAAVPNGNKRTITVPDGYPATGTHTAQVTFTDYASPVHTATVTKTFEVVALAPPPAPEPGAPPAPPTPPAPVQPPPCVSKLDFALSEFTTTGCFTKVSDDPEQWDTTDQVFLNGIPFADSGQRFLITFPTAAEPGGHVFSQAASIHLDRFIPFSGSIDWSLPAGGQGEEGVLHEIAVPSFAELFKLRIAGSIAIKLGWDANGKHYASFPLNVELPPAFTAGPTKFAGGVSGTAALRVDEDGVHYDGLKVAVSDVWLGRLKVASACFSYVPAGGQSVEPCEAPELDGQPYLTCNDDVNTDRWDGNAVIELPTASSTKVAAFGGLANGSVSKLGGFVDGLGTTVPLVPGVFLNRIGVGLCLNPPPFKLRGDVGVNALGGRLTVNGHFVYTDADDFHPWSVEVGGSASLADTELGTAAVTFNAWGDVDFALHAGMDIKEVASVEGDIAGWVEPRNNTFSVQGSVKGCIVSVICAKALGLVSSSGVAGCIDAGSITVPVPTNARQGPFGWGSVSFNVSYQTIYLKAGFGYRFGSGKVDLLGNSCDLSPYDAAKSARASASGITERVAKGTRAVAFRVHGTNGPPQIVVRGPHGAKIVSPADGKGTQRKGRYILAPNKSDGTTGVLLVKPAAGTWKVTAAPGATSSPTSADRSGFQAPPVLFGQHRRLGAGHEGAISYAIPAGATVSVVEHGKGVARTIVKSVRGKRCRGTKALPDGRRLLCARFPFLPSRGPGGTRTLQAVVTRGGLPIARKDLVSFRVPKETAPSKPGALKARRVAGALVVAFPASKGASRYTVSAELGDGRRLGFDLAGTCRAVRIADVPAGVAATVKVAGVRYDLRTGAYRKVKLVAGRASAGPRGKLPRRTCS